MTQNVKPSRILKKWEQIEWMQQLQLLKLHKASPEYLFQTVTAIDQFIAFLKFLKGEPGVKLWYASQQAEKMSRQTMDWRQLEL